MSELLPCPFCGGNIEELHKITVSDETELGTHEVVRCWICYGEAPEDRWNTRALPVQAEGREAQSALTKLAAECHRAKWQFVFNDEIRLPIGQARDLVKRAFGELHRIGDLILKARAALSPTGKNDPQ